MSKRSFFKNLSVNLCLLALLLVLFAISGCAALETSSVSQEETVDAPNEAVQQKVRRSMRHRSSSTPVAVRRFVRGSKDGRTGGNRKARDYIVQAFQKHGLQPYDGSLIQPFSYLSKEDNEEYRGANVVRYIEAPQIRTAT